MGRKLLRERTALFLDVNENFCMNGVGGYERRHRIYTYWTLNHFQSFIFTSLISSYKQIEW
jgi:hypothetical protein